MKKICLFIMIISLSGSVSAQTYEQVGWIAKFGLAAGFTPQWVSPDFEKINSKLSALGLEGFPEGGIITYGGGGYAYLMFMENLRIGGSGFSGSVSRTATINSLNREIVYSIGGGALTIEYTIPSIKNVAVSVGLMIGGGSADIEIFQRSSSLNWNNIWEEPNSPSQNTYKKITNSYYNISPTINLDIPFNRFLAFRIGGGYQFTVFNDWKYDNDQQLNEVSSGLNSNMFFIQTGIFAGFFAF